MLNGTWILAEKVCFYTFCKDLWVLFFIARFLAHLQMKWTPSSHSYCTSKSLFSKAVTCPWEPQTPGPKAKHLSPEKKYPKQRAWSYWPPEVERQVSFQLQPSLESANKANHGDLWDLDVHLIRGGLPALAVCASGRLSEWCILVASDWDYILTNEV